MSASSRGSSIAPLIQLRSKPLVDVTLTSMLMFIDPECVRTDLLEAGSTARWRDIAPQVMEQGIGAVAPNGDLGDPREASAAEGAVICAGLLQDLRKFVADWRELSTS